MAAREEVGEVAEELSRIGGTAKNVQGQFGEALPQEDAQVKVVEHLEVALVLIEQSKSITVEVERL